MVVKSAGKPMEKSTRLNVIPPIYNRTNKKKRKLENERIGNLQRWQHYQPNL